MKKRISKIIFLPILFFLFFNFPVNAEEWSKKDYFFESVFLSLHAIDYFQTIKLSKNQNKYKEMNIFLGDSPSQEKINLFFLGTSLLHIGIVHIMPQKYRIYFQTSSIVITAAIVGHNYGIGLKFGF